MSLLIQHNLIYNAKRSGIACLDNGKPRKKGPIWSFSGPYFLPLGLNTENNLHIILLCQKEPQFSSVIPLETN